MVNDRDLFGAFRLLLILLVGGLAEGGRRLCLYWLAGIPTDAGSLSEITAYTDVDHRMACWLRIPGRRAARAPFLRAI